ncbi:hypothetical protein CPB84DRAFT_1768497 [Gymnopilus junonius]|uniref:Uncharacterized protein n=1 Tax=Gymnopilus junonius TaxID=109634 RepID=A0A9P5NVB3_GYMJU|nr:hypothetical protein CPB84DRAFT_1768497 [Gymnopilus junonius]
MPIPFSAVGETEVEGSASQSRVGGGPVPASPRSRKVSTRGRERKRTLSGTRSSGQASSSTSTKSRKRPSNIPPPLPSPPLARPVSPSRSPSPPPPRRASAPAHANVHAHTRSSRRAVSSFSSASSVASRDSVDSRGPDTPCTPFFIASEASSVVVIAEGEGRGSVRGSGQGSTSTGSGSMRSSEDSVVGVDVGMDMDIAPGFERVLSQSEKEKFSPSGVLPVSPSSSGYSTSDSKRTGTHRSFSPTKKLQRAASPTPRVCLTRTRSRQTLAASVGPVSPPPSGPLPQPPAEVNEKEKDRKERVRHSTPTPSITRAELHAVRRGSSPLFPAASCEWPLHHHPSSVGVNVLTTPELTSLHASPSASAPTSPEEAGRRPSLAKDILYLSSSSSSLELQKLYQQGGQMTTADPDPNQEFSSSTSEYFSEDQATEEDLQYRRQRQHHLLSRLQGHLPRPSTETCDTSISMEEAAALLAANTRANAGIKDKIGIGRQQMGGGVRNRRKEGLEWTLGLGTSGESSAPSGSASTHVCASGVTPDSTPVAPAAPAPAFIATQKQRQHQQSQQQRTRKAGLSLNKASLPPYAARPPSGFLLDSADLSSSTWSRERCKSESAAATMPGGGSGRRGKEDWTLSLPGQVPEEWVKKIGGAGDAIVQDRNAHTNVNGSVRHSSPTPGSTADLLITVEDVDDPEGLDADADVTNMRLSMVRSSITSDPRVGEIVLCVPRVVSSGSGIEDVVMEETRKRFSLHSSMHEENDYREEQQVKTEAAEESAHALDQDPILEHKERVKSNAKVNLAKLEALSADLARFNEMLLSSVPRSRSHARASMPSPPRNLKHAKSCGVLEVDEPPPKNAVLRMPSVEVFLNDSEGLRSELDLGDENVEDGDDFEKEDEQKVVEPTTPRIVFSSVSLPATAASAHTTRPSMPRFSAPSMTTLSPVSPTTPSPTTPTRMRGPLPFAPFAPPSTFAACAGGKARMSEAAAAVGMNSGSGVSGVLASGLFGSSVNNGGRTMGRTLSSSTNHGVSALPTNKPSLRLQTSEPSASFSRPRVNRRTSTSSISSNSTASTTTVAIAAFPTSTLVPSPLMSPLETPMASSFPAPPPLSFPSLASAIVGGRSNSKSAKENARPSTTSSETSVSSVGTDETILPSVEQRMRMRLGLAGTGLLGSVESDHEREGTDEESMYSGTYYSARSSFSSERR